MRLRDLKFEDIPICQSIVAAHWGAEIAASAVLEMEEMFTSNSRWPPHYYVVENNFEIIGFGGFKSAWLMSNTYELIWVNVAPGAQGMGVGRMLTLARLDEIRRRGGTLVLLMSRRPAFFEQFEFETVCNFDDGMCLMVNQLAPITIERDRSI